ncbi:MAG: PhoPQ-activated pathogenicity-related family protein [Thermoguttaceae bacterium]
MFLVLTIFIGIAQLPSAETPFADSVPPQLDAYLNLPDDSFRWQIAEKIDDKTYIIEMTSQTWHDIQWNHSMLIVVPNGVVHPHHAVLYISGGSIGRKPSQTDILVARSLAEAAKMPVGLLMQVPNQPLFGDHREDSLIGETLLKAIESKDETWPLLFPMTKSAMRGMDVVQQCLKQQQGSDIASFIVTGASKRGWTSWLVGASGDSRVAAIAPVVIDTLNIRRQMDYQIETWGEFSPSIHDYTSRNLVKKEGTNQSDFEIQLWNMMDPFSYRSRLNMPKLLVHGTNDPYWTVDATKNYWDELSGIKYIATFPNVGHGLDGQQHRVIQTIGTFAQHAASGEQWPQMTWKMKENDSEYEIKVDTDLPVDRVKIWTAFSPSKDFRNAQWKGTSIKEKCDAVIVVAKPASGHVAFFVEVEGKREKTPFTLSTQVWRK